MQKWMARALPLALALVLALCACGNAGEPPGAAPHIASSSPQPAKGGAPSSSAPASSSVLPAPPPYELPDIPQRTERKGRWITFGQLPATDAEKAAALLLQAEVTGDFLPMEYLCENGMGEAVQAQIEALTAAYNAGLGTQWLRVEALQTLSAEALAAAEDPSTGRPLLEAQHRAAGESGDYAAFVADFLEQGNAVVSARVLRGYTEAALLQDAALRDGEEQLYFCFAQNSEGRPVVTGVLRGALPAGGA